MKFYKTNALVNNTSRDMIFAVGTSTVSLKAIQSPKEDILSAPINQYVLVNDIFESCV